jgi:hypothetical protein
LARNVLCADFSEWSFQRFFQLRDFSFEDSESDVFVCEEAQQEISDLRYDDDSIFTVDDQILEAILPERVVAMLLVSRPNVARYGGYYAGVSIVESTER